MPGFNQRGPMGEGPMTDVTANAPITVLQKKVL